MVLQKKTLSIMDLLYSKYTYDFNICITVGNIENFCLIRRFYTNVEAKKVDF